MQSIGPRDRWLKYSALLDMTGDWNWASRQASLVDATTQTDAVMEFAWLAHNRALNTARDHATFAMRLEQAGIAACISTLAKRFPALSGPRAIRDAGTAAPARIVVYTPQIVSGTHAPTAMALSIVELVCALGHECRLFAGQEMSIPFMAGLSGSGQMLAEPGINMASLQVRSACPVGVTLAETTSILDHRLPAVCQKIDQYAPDLVLFVGFFSPVIRHLWDYYPVLGLSTHATAPLLPADIWLSASGAGPDGAFDFPYRFRPVGPAVAEPAARSTLPAGAVLIMTTGHRLDHEITPAWADRMVALLDEYPELHWTLVGVRPDYRPAMLPDHPRIHVHGNVPKLASWLIAADIYANPPRLGGGASVAMAMEQGVPVAGLAGSDGADKLGAMAVGSEDDYFALLRAWVRDPTARRQVGAAMKQRFAERLDVTGADVRQRLAEALDQTCIAAAHRLKG